jgi:hypothetical protein
MAAEVRHTIETNLKEKCNLGLEEAKNCVDELIVKSFEYYFDF